MQVGRTVGRYLGGVVITALVIAGGMTGRIIQFARAGDPQQADAIIVLGAAQYDGDPSPVFAARLDHAKDLYDAGVAPRIITVGAGQEGDRTTEADAGAQYLTDAGLPESAVLAVAKGGDTLTSIRAVAKKALRQGWDSVIVVSDPWHVARARMIARGAGLSAEVSPVTEGPAAAQSVEGRYVWRELLGSLYYRLTGGSSGAGKAVL